MAKKADIIRERSPDLHKEMAPKSCKKRPPMTKPHNSEARYLQKLFKVTMPSPKKITVADIMNNDIPDSPVLR
jgi:hypothetical protein